MSHLAFIPLLVTLAPVLIVALLVLIPTFREEPAAEEQDRQ